MAGLLHGGLAPQHFQEWEGYGAFFVAAAGLQVLLALALLGDAFGPGACGPAARRWDRRMVWAGLGLQAALLGVYAYTRLGAVPWLGPAAGQRAAVGALDLLTVGLESVSVVALALMVRVGVRGGARVSDP